MQAVVVDAMPFVFILGPPGPPPVSPISVLVIGGSSSSVGGGQGAILTGSFANPNGNVTPTDPTQGAWYYQEGATPNWWQWNVSSQIWNQVAG